MTRINTNISALNALYQLNKNVFAQDTSIMRLSSGLRINKASDDPTGMVASETLSKEITSSHQAIANCQRANQLLMTADSALSEMNGLLNEIRGLINQAANSGTMSYDMIQANQLQIDSTLEAIDRIAYMTQFEGKNLLDGSLDFTVDGLDENRIVGLQIDQANFGEYNEQGVAIQVEAPATQGELRYDFGAVPEDLVLEIGGLEGFEAFNISGGSSIEQIAQAVNLVSDATGVEAVVEEGATAGAVTVSSYGKNNDIIFNATEPGKDQGNLTVQYTADPTGNPNLTIDYTPSDGETPGVINVNLVTEQWQNALYRYNGGDDGTSNNSFEVIAREPGTEFNGPDGVSGMTYVINNNAAPGPGIPAASYDHSTGVMTFEVYYNVGNPADPNNTSVNELADVFRADPQLNTMFDFNTTVLSSDGTGPVVPTTPVNFITAGVDGGTIQTTAQDIVNAIAADPVVSTLVNASLAEGNTGITTVTDFDEYAYSGVAEQNNNLQFLGPEDTRPIRFVSTPGEMLELDVTTDPPVYDNPSAIVQGFSDGSSFKITALQPGAEYDDIQVIIQDDPDGLIAVPINQNEAASYDPQNKVLTLTVNFSGRDAAGPGNEFTLPDMLDLVNNNPVVNQYFQADALDPGYDPLAPPEFDNATYLGYVPIDAGSLSGGVVSEGTIVIHLETDEDGMVQTTANDLLTYLDNPRNVAEQQLFAELGISASLINESDGTGLIVPTEELEGGKFDDTTFKKAGVTEVASNSRVTINSDRGVNGMFDIWAVQEGDEYNDVLVQIVPDPLATAGAPSVRYDETAKILTVGIQTSVGVTEVNHIITQINNYVHPTLGAVFAADTTKDVFGIPGLDSDGTADAPTSTFLATLSGGIVEQGTEEGVPMVGNEDTVNTGLAFRSVEYGSNGFVTVRVLNGSNFNLRNPEGEVAERDAGSDINAIINGVRAVGQGNTAIVNAPTLDMAVTVSKEVEAGDVLNFRITGGGMQVQLGIDVEATQQARISLQSIHTATLGDLAGRLYQLRTGQDFDLMSNPAGAAAIVSEVSLAISQFRGRIGAFQKSSLESNMNQMTDAVEVLTQARSDIRDADFAAETAELTRTQILVQSGMQVLSIANDRPNQVLSLLQQSGR